MPTYLEIIHIEGKPGKSSSGSITDGGAASIILDHKDIKTTLLVGRSPDGDKTFVYRSKPDKEFRIDWRIYNEKMLPLVDIKYLDNKGNPITILTKNQEFYYPTSKGQVVTISHE